MRWTAFFLLVAGCSSQPEWLPVENSPGKAVHVALKKEGGLVRATLRTVAEKTPGKSPTYSTFIVMLVNCQEKSVSQVSHEFVDDALGRTVFKNEMPKRFDRWTNWDTSLPRRACDHVVDGRPWA
jgi:hypothetical protein